MAAQVRQASPFCGDPGDGLSTAISILQALDEGASEARSGNVRKRTEGWQNDMMEALVAWFAVPPSAPKTHEMVLLVSDIGRSDLPSPA